MRKTGYMLAGFLSFAVLLTGCSKKGEIRPMEYVVCVEIDCLYREKVLHRKYENPDKMDIILHYLYTLEPENGTVTEDPDQFGGDCCKITIKLSHGESRVYRQQGEGYLSVDSHKWQKIPKSQGKLLFHLVNHIESD